MKVKWAGTGLILWAFGLMAMAERLNEWMFKQDTAGLTLALTTNSETSHAVFSSGGERFLETDGIGSLP